MAAALCLRTKTAMQAQLLSSAHHQRGYTVLSWQMRTSCTFDISCRLTVGLGLMQKLQLCAAKTWTMTT